MVSLYTLGMNRKESFTTGEYYHLYNRGVDKRIIFQSEQDYQRFLMLLFVSNNTDTPFRLDNVLRQNRKTFHDIFHTERKGTLVSIIAWCLMPNHFHLLVKQNEEGGISKFLQRVGTGYTMFFNIKYKRQGALFSGTFKSKHIGDDEVYFRHLFSYIHLNPLGLAFPKWKEKCTISSEMITSLQKYRYSSYNDFYQKTDRVERLLIEKENLPADISFSPEKLFSYYNNYIKENKTIRSKS